MNPMAGLKDIALAAGVSVDTVSRVLNGKAGEWPSAVRRAERIREIAEKLNYAPNKAAQIMRTKKSRQIGVVVSELYNPFTGRKVEATAEALASHGYEMLLGLTRSQASDPTVFFEKFSRNLLDGFINLDPALGFNELKRLGRRLPFVIFNRSEEESPAIFDIAAAMHLMMDHLWSLGHRKIGLVTGFDKGDAKLKRVSAYQSFYATRPIAASPTWIIQANWTPEAGFSAAKALVETDCTACVAGNDLLAVGLTAGLRALQRDVPRDYSVVSIEDSLLTQIAFPTLTSAKQPVEALVQATVQALVDMLEGRPVAPCQIFPPTLVVRQSCASIAI